jgi:glycosyltransferase involved in cell wall biosynthesis
MIVFVVTGRLGKSLVVSKVEPLIATGRVNKVYIFSQEPGYPIHGAEYIPLPKWVHALRPAFLSRTIRFLYEPLQLLRYTIKLKPNLINGVFTLPKGLNSTIVGKLTQTKSIVSVIGGIVEIPTRLPFKWLWKCINLAMLRNCDAVTTKGTNVSAYLIDEGIPKSKIFNLVGSINTDKFFYDPGIQKDIDVLFVGNFRRLKGPDRVLEVVRSLIQDGILTKCVFLGAGVLYDEIREQIEAKKLETYVFLKGYQNHPAPYFQRSRTIMIPSTSEGLPMVMVEAMACGCVPVVSDVGNVRDAAHHEINAMVIEKFDDLPAFYKATRRLLTDESLWKRLSVNGIKTVLGAYTPHVQGKIVDQMLTYLKLP